MRKALDQQTVRAGKACVKASTAQLVAVAEIHESRWCGKQADGGCLHQSAPPKGALQFRQSAAIPSTPARKPMAVARGGPPHLGRCVRSYVTNHITAVVWPTPLCGVPHLIDAAGDVHHRRDAT
jgi:hypothetical protein